MVEVALPNLDGSFVPRSCLSSVFLAAATSRDYTIHGRLLYSGTVFLSE
jgi:hypothetical protein